MSEQNIVKYQDLKLPCCTGVIENALNPLEEEIKKVFAGGFEEVKKVQEVRLFRWMAKLVYGILYHDIVYAIKQQNTKGQKFTISPWLTTKFKILHFMLQSLVLPMEFKGTKKWTNRVVKIKYSKDVFTVEEFCQYVRLEQDTVARQLH